jgi:amidase
VADVALGLSVIAGADARDPQSWESDPHTFKAPLDRDWRGTRIAWSIALGGLPVDRRVSKVLEAKRRTFEDLGCVVEDACPDFGDVNEIFLTLRTWASWTTYKDLLAQHRSQFKPDAVWDIESGAHLTGEDLGRALTRQGLLIERMRAFHEKYSFLVCAVNQVPPFDAGEPWPKSIEGVAMENYVAWMKTAYWISATCCPAISVPAGFTDDGLPVGIQIVGRYRRDFEVLAVAHAFEQATGFGKRRPPGV